MVTYIYIKNAHGPDVCASLLKTYVSLLIVPASGALLLQQASALWLCLLPTTMMIVLDFVLVHL